MAMARFIEQVEERFSSGGRKLDVAAWDDLSLAVLECLATIGPVLYSCQFVVIAHRALVGNWILTGVPRLSPAKSRVVTFTFSFFRKLLRPVNEKYTA
ncbi:hypothetical protein EVAR_53217_1 [Eumeta japonica]|uniref:Uncharacterized protein n=1 Tax=Eumeta variegata TaxID=151549 RepID=A0A4C1XDM7_EUMVA|nr:hypothetical protein EVAR_53217_1 [Eumeta japonica]